MNDTQKQQLAEFFKVLYHFNDSKAKLDFVAKNIQTLSIEEIQKEVKNCNFTKSMLKIAISDFNRNANERDVTLNSIIENEVTAETIISNKSE